MYVCIKYRTATARIKCHRLLLLFLKPQKSIERFANDWPTKNVSYVLNARSILFISKIGHRDLIIITAEIFDINMPKERK